MILSFLRIYQILVIPLCYEHSTENREAKYQEEGHNGPSSSHSPVPPWGPHPPPHELFNILKVFHFVWIPTKSFLFEAIILFHYSYCFNFARRLWKAWYITMNGIGHWIDLSRSFHDLVHRRISLISIEICFVHCVFAFVFRSHVSLSLLSQPLRATVEDYVGSLLCKSGDCKLDWTRLET